MLLGQSLLTLSQCLSNLLQLCFPFEYFVAQAAVILPQLFPDIVKPFGQLRLRCFFFGLGAKLFNGGLVFQVHGTRGGSDEALGLLKNDLAPGRLDALGDGRAGNPVPLSQGNYLFPFEHSALLSFHLDDTVPFQ